jgi:hypothetical protein
VFREFCGTHTSGERLDILCATSCGATVRFSLPRRLQIHYI